MDNTPSIPLPWVKWTSATPLIGEPSAYHNNTHELFKIGSVSYMANAYWNVVDPDKIQESLVNTTIAHTPILHNLACVKKIADGVKATTNVLARVMLHRAQVKLGHIEDAACTWSFVGGAYNVLHARSSRLFTMAASIDKAKKNTALMSSFYTFVRGLNACTEGIAVISYLQTYIKETPTISSDHFTDQELDYTAGLKLPVHIGRTTLGPLVDIQLNLYGEQTV